MPCGSCELGRIDDQYDRDAAMKLTKQFIRGLLTEREVGVRPHVDAVLSCASKRKDGTCDCFQPE